jgi:hypothetical protein
MSNINETNIFIFRLTKNDKPIDGHHYSIWWNNIDLIGKGKSSKGDGAKILRDVVQKYKNEILNIDLTDTQRKYVKATPNCKDSMTNDLCGILLKFMKYIFSKNILRW